MRPLFRLKQEILVRLLADVVMINGALLASFAVRFFSLVALEGMDSPHAYSEVFWTYVRAYTHVSLMVTAVCLTAFSLSGFYTYGRSYRGRYKAFVIAQAVTVSYLVFASLLYFLKGTIDLPRGVLLLAWIGTTALLLMARFLSLLWSDVISAERHLPETRRDRKILDVLVVGGAGYIGSALLPKLLERGYRVTVFDLLVYGIEPITHLLENPNLTVIKADFRQVDKVVEVVQHMDAVIHLGAIVGDPACALDKDLTIEVNLMATRMIAEVAKGSGVSRFIFASTCSVYGANDEFVDERSALNPVSLYARSKIASEKVLMSLADDPFAPIILRFGTIYGLSGRTRFDLVVNMLAAKALQEGEITVIGGNQWRPFVHVDDAALAVLKALEAPFQLVKNQTFNVGSDQQNYTVLQVAQTIQKLVPSSSLTIVQNSDDDRRNYKVRFTKIQNVLRFVPEWTVEDGVRQVIQAIQDGKVLDYRDAEYSNVKFLSEEGAYRAIRSQNSWAYDLIEEEHPAAFSSEER